MSIEGYYQDNDGFWIKCQATKDFEDEVVLYEDEGCYDAEGCWHEGTEVTLTVQGTGMPAKPTYENMGQFDNGKIAI